jgi:hypothetical protein
VKEKNKMGTEEEDAEEKRKVNGVENRKSNTASCIVSVPTHFLRRERDRSNPLLVTTNWPPLTTRCEVTSLVECSVTANKIGTGLSLAHGRQEKKCLHFLD